MSEENVREDEVQEEDVELEEQNDDESTEEESVDWKARALKAEALIVKNKKESKAEPKQENFKNTTSDARIDRMELRQLGYTDDVIEQVMELGGPSALKNPVVKKAADDLMAQAKAEQASTVSGTTQQQPLTKYTRQDLENMSVEELEKILPHADR